MLRQTGVAMSDVKFKSWSFPHIIEGLRDLCGVLNLQVQRYGSEEKILANRVEWERLLRTCEGEVLDRLGRDCLLLDRLIPSTDEVVAAIPAAARRLVPRAELKRKICAVNACQGLAADSCGRFGYRVHSRRTAYCQLAYWIALEIQGDDRTPARQQLSQDFLLQLFSYGQEKLGNDPDLRTQVDEFERLLGWMFATRIVALVITRDGDFSVEDLVQLALEKYGTRNVLLLFTCKWCGGVPCVCGTRWSASADKRVITSEHLANSGLPEMMRMMWCAYGVRNGSIGTLAGVVRATTESLGEEAFRSFVADLASVGTETYGRDCLKRLDRFGPFAARDTRLYDMVRQGIRSGEDLRVGHVKEIGDAALTWPTLVAIAFGLDLTRGFVGWLKQVAVDERIMIRMPTDLTTTGPVDIGTTCTVGPV